MLEMYQLIECKSAYRTDTLESLRGHCPSGRMNDSLLVRQPCNGVHYIVSNLLPCVSHTAMRELGRRKLVISATGNDRRRETTQTAFVLLEQCPRVCGVTAGRCHNVVTQRNTSSDNETD